MKNKINVGDILIGLNEVYEVKEIQITDYYSTPDPFYLVDVWVGGSGFEDSNGMGFTDSDIKKHFKVYKACSFPHNNIY